MERRTPTGTRTEVRVTDVVEGIGHTGDDHGDLVCTEDAPEFRLDGETRALPRESVARAYTDVDRSATGFKPIALVFAVATALLGYVCLSSFDAGAPLDSVVVLGTGSSTVLASAGVAWLWRLNGVPRSVLYVDRTDGTRVVYSTAGGERAFDDVEALLP